MTSRLLKLRKRKLYEACHAAPVVAASAALPTITVRNLLYYIYPVTGNGIWQRNVTHLLRRLPLFNGRRVVAIATDGRKLDPPGKVKDSFLGTVTDFITIRNKPGLREVAAFLPLWQTVQSGDLDGQVTFYGHSKGVTRPVNPGVTVHPWTDIMYSCCLDYWPFVERQLLTYPITGPFKKVGHGFTGSQSQWHYSGAFWWLRNAALQTRNWKEVDQKWWGTESWAGLHFTTKEAGCLFHTGRVPTLNLYSMPYLRNTVIPAWHDWKEHHQEDRKTWE